MIVFWTVRAALWDLSAARRDVDAHYQELELYGGNSSLHREFLRQARQAEETATQISRLKERIEAIKQTRKQSVEMAERQTQDLVAQSELLDAAVNDLLSRMRVIEGAVLQVSLLSPSKTEYLLMRRCTSSTSLRGLR